MEADLIRSPVDRHAVPLRARAPISRSPGRALVAVLPLAVALAAWAYSLTRLHLSSVGLYGLLDEADGWFFVGFATIVVGFGTELSRRRPRAWLMTLYLIGLIVMIHATVPLLTRIPEYGWVYKHVGVIQTFRVYGRITNPNDIYQGWPVFFAAAAGIGSAAGVSTISFATWAPLAFELFDCLMLLAVFRVLARNDRTAFLGVAIFEAVVAWVAQDYLSPQGFAFVLWLGMMLIVARWLLTAPEPGLELAPASGRRRQQVRQLRAWLVRGVELPPAPSRAARRTATAAVLVVFFAIVAAHQLTPYVGLLALVPLTLLDLVRPRWLVIALGAIAAAYLIPRLGIVAQFGGLFSGLNFVQNASGPVRVPASNAQAFMANVDRALYVATLLSAGLLALRAWRSPGRVVIPVVLAFSPILLLAVQSYGGEGVIRVFLFSCPWCALLIAEGLTSIPYRRPLAIVSALALGALLLLSIEGLFGPLAYLIFTPRELTTSEWLYSHLPRNSQLLTPDDNFPELESANPRHLTIKLIPDDPQSGPVLVDPRKLSALDSWVALNGTANSYLIISPSMLKYAKFFATPQIGGLLSAVEHSRDWRLYHSDGPVRIFHYVGRLGPPVARHSHRSHTTPTRRRRQP